jgi:hypothetical protein
VLVRCSQEQLPSWKHAAFFIIHPVRAMPEAVKIAAGVVEEPGQRVSARTRASGGDEVGKETGQWAGRRQRVGAGAAQRTSAEHVACLLEQQMADGLGGIGIVDP